MDFKNLTAPISLARKTNHYIYEGMSFTADVREGVQWPTLAEDDSVDAPQLPLRFVEPAAVGPQNGALTVVAPRFLYDNGRLLAEANVVQSRLRRPGLLLSRPDAEKLGVSNGDEVTVSHNGASVALPARVNRMLDEGVALVPRNLDGRPAERLVGSGGLYATVDVEKS
jgi:predicted molibdopterin-dependent oxidoreductase YjgC